VPAPALALGGRRPCLSAPPASATPRRMPMLTSSGPPLRASTPTTHARTGESGHGQAAAPAQRLPSLPPTCRSCCACCSAAGTPRARRPPAGARRRRCAAPAVTAPPPCPSGPAGAAAPGGCTRPAPRTAAGTPGPQSPGRRWCRRGGVALLLLLPEWGRGCCRRRRRRRRRRRCRCCCCCRRRCRRRRWWLWHPAAAAVPLRPAAPDPSGPRRPRAATPGPAKAAGREGGQ
jgi:hypothetical protein